MRTQKEIDDEYTSKCTVAGHLHNRLSIDKLSWAEHLKKREDEVLKAFEECHKLCLEESKPEEPKEEPKNEEEKKEIESENKESS